MNVLGRLWLANWIESYPVIQLIKLRRILYGTWQYLSLMTARLPWLPVDFLFPKKMHQAVSGTSAATCKLMEPHSFARSIGNHLFLSFLVYFLLRVSFLKLIWILCRYSWHGSATPAANKTWVTCVNMTSRFSIACRVTFIYHLFSVSLKLAVFNGS